MPGWRVFDSGFKALVIEFEILHCCEAIYLMTQRPVNFENYITHLGSGLIIVLSNTAFLKSEMDGRRNISTSQNKHYHNPTLVS